uniref:DUF6928 family protein n=1 Tax=Nocardia farcinica TaxID=37329 RepID=UPI0024538AE4
MVSTASTLWYVDAEDPAAVLRAHRDPDPAAAQALAEQLFGEFEIVPKMIGTLAGCAGPDPDEVYIGRYPGLTVVCTRAARLPDPADLPELLVRPLASDHTYLVSFDTGMGWGAFAHWERGEFRRGFSSSRMKILADAGLPYVWERPFWAGERPVLWRADELPDPQCLPFDPPDFADEASRRWLGFQYRAPVVAGALLPRDIAVCGFTLVPKSPPPETPAPEPDPGGAHGRGHGVNKSGTHGRSHGRRRGPRALEVGRPAQPADAAAPPQAWPQDATSEAPDSAGEPASAERKRATDTDVDPGAEGSSRRAHPHHQAADTRSATGPGAAEPSGGPHPPPNEPPGSTPTRAPPRPRGNARGPPA